MMTSAVNARRSSHDYTVATSPGQGSPYMENGGKVTAGNRHEVETSTNPGEDAIALRRHRRERDCRHCGPGTLRPS